MATPHSPSLTTPLRTGTPLRTPLRSGTTPKDESTNPWIDTERDVEELKAVELLPLVMDIVEGANSDTLRPQDVENAAGPIRVRITRAREVLRTMHGLSETPEEREERVLRLKRNIEVKSRALQKFKAMVGEKWTLSTQEELQQISRIDGEEDVDMSGV